jgi:AhpD family alkylhydroperoxidase
MRGRLKTPYGEEHAMPRRVNYITAWPEAAKAMLALQDAVNTSGLETPLVNLVCLRASQINGCAYCIDMHSKDALAGGESEDRLYLLDAWRDTSAYSDRERAALAWTEAVTRVSDGHVPDDVYDQARSEFSDEELVKLTLAIATINAWNRFGIAFRLPPGHYQPQRHAVGVA